MREFKVSEIAKLINSEVIGNSELIVRGIASFDEADEDDLTFFADGNLRDTRSKVVLLPKDSKVEFEDKTLMFVDNVYSAVVRIAYLFEEESYQPMISPHAVIYPNVKIGRDVTIREFVVIEEGTVIGDKVVIMPFVYIGKECVIGDGTIIFPGAIIHSRSMIGRNCRIGAGSVIGSDGFGYVEVDGKRVRIPHLGRVVIEDEVDIGANTTIDRGTFGSTVIGKGTKIDNLVQIAHNVKIGENCVFAAQVGISGSVRLGNKVMLGGQVGIADHAVIGDSVKVAAKSGVSGRVKDGEVLAGIPAISASKWKRVQAIISKLPEIYSKLRRGSGD
ncbi:MAG: UDP-3-O-(3-hydroxymyristoyl)glucosamine N-acyltransferase [Thermosulfidibacteraceae bacterium]|jgi:UDP-3-O-[3-hydroxymyristoyl] glucosamine N-acyltransferase